MKAAFAIIALLLADIPPLYAANTLELDGLYVENPSEGNGKPGVLFFQECPSAQTGQTLVVNGLVAKFQVGPQGRAAPPIVPDSAVGKIVVKAGPDGTTQQLLKLRTSAFYVEGSFHERFEETSPPDARFFSGLFVLFIGRESINCTYSLEMVRSPQRRS
jgi:hypothetical protein